MEIDSRKTILKICIPTVAGLLIGIYFICRGGDAGYLLILPIYLIGLVYGITRIGPWMIAFLRSMFKAMASLFLFRMFLWAIVILILVPIGLGLLTLVCWIVGFPMAVMEVIRLIRERKACGSGTRRRRFRLPNLSLPSRRKRRNRLEEYDDDDYGEF